MFADAIDFPLLLVYGMAVLVPLLLFQVGVEGLVLKYMWDVPFHEVARFAFRANCWSLLAGMPTKIVNAAVYSMLLPRDLPQFFARYPFAVGVGTLLYFIVTILIEHVYAFRWWKGRQAPFRQRSIWMGVLVANLGTYAVLAPLHYYVTRPIHDVVQFTEDACWSRNAGTELVFIDSKKGHLSMKRLGTNVETTIVPGFVKDYLVSRDGGTCLFRSERGDLVLFQGSTGRSNVIWNTNERFSMNQAAFSPSGARAAFASAQDRRVEVVDVMTGNRARKDLPTQWEDFNVAWSNEEARFYVSDGRAKRLAADVTPDFSVSLTAIDHTNDLPLLLSYGRVGGGRWGTGKDWGKSYGKDGCGHLRAWALRGLGSSLRIHGDDGAAERPFTIAVNPGVLHLAAIQFRDVAFLDGCAECVFEAGEYIYVLDIEQKAVGTVAKGEKFILFTPRYQKRL